MQKFKRFFVLTAILVFTLTAVCSASAGPQEDSAKTDGPAAAVTPPDQESDGPMEALIGFIETVKSGDPSIIKYLDSGAKEHIAEQTVEYMQDGPEKDKIKSEVRRQLDDTDSELAKSIAKELAGNDFFDGIDIEGLKASVTVKIEGDQAYIRDAEDAEEGDFILLVREADGWKLSHEMLGM